MNHKRKAVWRAINRLEQRHGPVIGKAFREAVDVLRQPNEAELRSALERGQTERAVDSFPWGVFRQGFEASARAAIFATAKGAGRMHAPVIIHKVVDPSFAAAFNLTNPRAIVAAITQTADLVTGIDTETRQAIREIIRRGAAGELDIDAQVKLLRQIIGLNVPGANAAMNYRLAREAEGLAAERVDELSQRYVERAIRQRAEMIARTETIRAANIGQQELWQQALEGGYIDRTALQVWVASPDACDDCVDLDEQVAELGQPFDGPEGPILGPPAHPNCRCALSLDTTATMV